MARTTGSNGEETAARIRRSALELIAGSGFEAMSMRSLADAVGVQVAALYRYFPTKQALLFDLMSGHMKALLDAWRQAALAHQGMAAADRLEAFARFHIRYHITRPHEVFIAYMELRSLSEVNYAQIGRLRQEYESIPKSILGEGMKTGEFDIGDAHVTSMAILAMLTGITTWYRPGGRLSARHVEDHYAALACRMVTGAADLQDAAASTILSAPAKQAGR